MYDATPTSSRLWFPKPSTSQRPAPPVRNETRATASSHRRTMLCFLLKFKDNT